MNTERRLRLAEDSLKRLDKALKDSGVKIDLQIETDVKNLKGKPIPLTLALSIHKLDQSSLHEGRFGSIQLNKLCSGMLFEGEVYGKKNLAM